MATTHDGSGHLQHFSHPRPTPRPFVPDHDRVAGSDLARLNSLKGRFLVLEHAGRALERKVFIESRNLHDPAARRDIPAENRDCPFLMDRIVDRPDNIRIRLWEVELGEVLCHRLSRDR